MNTYVQGLDDIPALMRITIQSTVPSVHRSGPPSAKGVT